MSDDEAFIRAIVDAPGDDAPRLIYADWLDERGDPRGAYLRAEVRLFDANRDGVDKATIKLFQLTWKKIDQVWSARVSRLPIGICCEHIRFSKCEPSIQHSAFAETEADLQVKLPATYKAFLLNHNGGIPEPKWYRRSNHPAPELAVRFYPVTDSPQTESTGQRYSGNLLQATQTLYSGRYSPTGPRRLIPIMAASYPVSILIGVVGVRNGCIYRQANPHLEGDEGTGDLVKIADSLQSFLASFHARK